MSQAAAMPGEAEPAAAGSDDAGIRVPFWVIYGVLLTLHAGQISAGAVGSAASGRALWCDTLPKPDEAPGRGSSLNRRYG